MPLGPGCRQVSVLPSNLARKRQIQPVGPGGPALVGLTDGLQQGIECHAATQTEGRKDGGCHGMCVDAVKNASISGLRLIPIINPV